MDWTTFGGSRNERTIVRTALLTAVDTVRFGEDKDVEELVQIWERGEFDALYISIFGRPRPEIYIPERFR